MPYQITPDLSARPGPAQPPSLQEMATLADSEITDQFDEAYLVGVAVALIKDGQIVCRSYGHTDRQAQREVDAQRSLFRMGSVSKLLTATAVLQLVEQGRLDLATDINDYLPGRPIPPTFDRPVTLKHLLTHTAGFEVNSLGFTVTRNIHDTTPLLDTLLRHQPARVRPPARDFSECDAIGYSNWGIALAGAIVGEVSGQPFEDYVEKQIFAPLQMQRSSFREPLPAHLAADMSLGYSGDEHYRAGHFHPLKNVGPAGSLSCTVEDMARFVRMQLEQGRGPDGPLLQPETLAQMQSRQYAAHPQLPGLGLVWLEQYCNGHRLLTHGGRTPLFVSNVHIFPEQRLGVVVAYNSNPPEEYKGQLIRRIMDRHYPAELPPAPQRPRQSQLKAAASSYQGQAASETTWEKATRAVQCSVIKKTADDRLLIPEEGLDEPDRWVESAQSPGVFRREQGDQLIALTKDSRGRQWLHGLTLPVPLMRAPWWSRPDTNAAILGVFLAILGLGTFAATSLPAQAGGLFWSSITLAGINVALLTLLGLTLLQLRDPDPMLARLPKTLLATQTLGLLSALATLVLCITLTQAGQQELLGPGELLIFGLYACATLAFLGWLHFWRFLGFRQARRLFPISLSRRR